MLRIPRSVVYVAVCLSLILSACRTGKVTPTANPPPLTAVITLDSAPVITRSPSSTSEESPGNQRVLSICLGQEPVSLFLYGDSSGGAKSVLEAIYDGPFDRRDYDLQPVILEEVPSLSGGNASLQPVTVRSGELIADRAGELVSLQPGVRYRPSGCAGDDCSLVYSGSEEASLDQLVVRFTILPGLLWSDGIPLTSADSVFAYDVARSMYPSYRPELLSFTQSYLALDEQTVEWKGVPGLMDSQYQTNFFFPFPKHAWGSIPVEELNSNEMAVRKPIGWGPYVIEEWVEGEHISLKKNPRYFRSAEGLPRFDGLVYRFVSDGEEALQALLTGRCDLIDTSAMLEDRLTEVLDYQEKGRISVHFQPGTGWEQATFGIATQEEGRPAFFGQREVRQAIALCIDRGRIIDELFMGNSTVPESFVLPDHPLYNSEVEGYPYDPLKGAELLSSAGWMDQDGDPATPRVAQGVQGAPDGARFEFDYLAPAGVEYETAGRVVEESLAGCGIHINHTPLPWEEMMAGGPEGPVFGQKFDMAQFSWMNSFEPFCRIYRSDEIPGSYPEHRKGWGGANAGGYQNPEYDAACQAALGSPPDQPQYLEAHRRAQAIYAADLPSVPLFWRFRLIASRPDMCGVIVSNPFENVLWNLEAFDYAEGCTG